MAKNAFEALLETLPDEEVELKGPVRQVISQLAEKVPKLRDSVLAQADYSRKMDEVKTQIDLANNWNKWRAENWLDDKSMTKTELQKAERLAELEQELESARRAAAKSGDDMTFDQLEEYLKDLPSKKGLITKTDLESVLTDRGKQFEDTLKNNSAAMFSAAVKAGDLNLRHMKEFGDPFDTMEFIAEANKKGRFGIDGLNDFYEKDFVLGKRQEIVEKRHKEELEKANAEKDAAIKAANDQLERYKTQTTNSGNPIESGSPDLGPLQRKLAGLDSTVEDGAIPKDLPLGSVSQAAARRDDLRDAMARTA